MSLTPKNRSTPLDAPLLGVCLGVILSIPLMGILAVVFGSDYDSRVWIYGLGMLWSVVGALSVFFATYKNPGALTGKRLVLWCVSVWIWPLVLLVKRR